MRDAIALFFGAVVGSASSFTVALAYIAVVRRVGHKVFGSWLVFLWFPVHCIFALILTLPSMFFLVLALRLVGASFPLSNTVSAMVIVFCILSLILPFTYFFRQWYHLKRAGYLPPLRGLTNR
jgi:hypothetical protein